MGGGVVGNGWVTEQVSSAYLDAQGIRSFCVVSLRPQCGHRQLQKVPEGRGFRFRPPPPRRIGLRYSPAPSTAHKQFLDLHLSDELAAAQDPFALLDKLWRTCLFGEQHVYPAQMVEVPNCASWFVFIPAPAGVARNMDLITMSDPGNFGCFFYEWRSWAWQCVTFPAARRSWEPAVRAIQTAEQPATPLDVAARHAFYDLPRTTVESIGGKLGAEMSLADDLFAVLFKTLAAALDTPPVETIDILRARLVSLSCSERRACTISWRWRMPPTFCRRTKPAR